VFAVNDSQVRRNSIAYCADSLVFFWHITLLVHPTPIGNIESLQDLSTYDSKQQSMGGSLSVGYGRMSGSVSASKSTVNSNFASVTEQSGIKIGDDGFIVNVKGATDLKGAVLASTDKAVAEGKNSFATGSLTMSDIQNHAEASAETSGFTLDSSMLSRGKYGIAKAVAMNALDNAEASSSSNGLTRSAISGSTVTIADEQKQIELTGKNIEQTLAELNRDTANSHTAAQKQDAQALQKEAEATRAIKETAMQVVSVNMDEAYHAMFEEKHPVYVVEKDEEGKTNYRPLGEGEQLQAGPDGKVNVATNGIYNSPEEAINNAMQNAGGKKGPMYVVYFPQTGNIVSELFVASYQKTLEGDWTGLTNSTSQLKDYIGQYGQSGLNMYGHSRGGLTIGNAVDSQANSANGYGSMSNTNIYLYGPAANAQNMAGQLSYTSGGAVDHVYLQNHNADFVGSWLGGNPSGGYNQIPEKSSYIGQMLYIVGGAWAGEKTVHSCYGNGGYACTKPYGLPVTQIINAERVQPKK
jgi:filamentous hemagglutinin